MALYSVARFLELTGAAVLVGGLAATVGIAQIAFGSPDILSREQAGRFMAKVFEGSVFVEAAAAAMMLAGGLLRRAKPAFLLGAVAVAIVAAHFWLVERMGEIRSRHGGTVQGLEAGHEDRRAFGKFHGIYSASTLVLLMVGAGALYGGRAPEKKGS